MTANTKTSLSLFDAALVKPALWGAFAKLNPRTQWRNPVMFIVYIGSILTTLLWVHALSFPGDTGMKPAFVLAVTIWLWFTVLFANFAEALAEGRSKAQAASLRGLRKDTWAKKLHEPHHGARFAAGPPQGEAAPSGAARHTQWQARGPTAGCRSRRPTCARATSCWSRPAT